MADSSPSASDDHLLNDLLLNIFKLSFLNLSGLWEEEIEAFI